MKNYAFRSGLYLGTLESLKYDNDIFKMFNCDKDKMDKFTAYLEKRLESLTQRVNDYEQV